MSEVLKFDKNGQWSLDKAQIIDMKYKKSVANLPSPDVGKRPKLGLMGAAKPKIHEPDTSSEHTDPSLNPGLGGKHGKIHGGDPRKEKDNVEHINGKPRQRISGASGLRRKYEEEHDLTNAPREKHPVKKCEELLDQMLETLEKMAVPGIKSNHIFSMDHINQVAKTPDHATAKKIAHEAIRSSGAHEQNKAKASLAVDQSKDHKHLAQTMTNFHMARDARVRRRLGGQKDDE